MVRRAAVWRVPVRRWVAVMVWGRPWRRRIDFWVDAGFEGWICCWCWMRVRISEIDSVRPEMSRYWRREMWDRRDLVWVSIDAGIGVGVGVVVVVLLLEDLSCLGLC